jgi:hypothetical protein
MLTLSIKVRPSFSSNDSSNGGLSNSVFFTEFALTEPASTVFRNNFRCLSVCKFRGLVFLTESTFVWVSAGVHSVASLIKHVSHVLFVGSKKQVIGIATRTVVTMVAYAESFRNCAKRQLPRHPVSASIFPIFGDNSVPIQRHSPLPRPAFEFISIFYPAPKSFWKSFFVRLNPKPNHSFAVLWRHIYTHYIYDAQERQS